VGRLESRSQPQQRTRPGAILANDADRRAIRRNNIERIQRRTTDFSKLNGHA
jgi:hypothetical protein